MKSLVVALALFCLLPITACSNGQPHPSTVAAATPFAGDVVFSGGIDTDPRDHGRPVVLIGNALGVTPEIFRDAFSGVNPSSAGPPSASRAKANKKVLLDKLGPYGITNERLDEVSNYYRYNPGGGEIWTHKPAVGKAIVTDGVVSRVEVVDGGSGYTTPPTVTIADHPNVRVIARIEFSTDMKQNGRVAELIIE